MGSRLKQALTETAPAAARSTTATTADASNPHEVAATTTRGMRNRSRNGAANATMLEKTTTRETRGAEGSLREGTRRVLVDLRGESGAPLAQDKQRLMPAQ
jgi:hypothetical protein